MATGGRLSRSKIHASDQIIDFPCTPCVKKNKSNESVKYCPECQEYLCAFCVENHNSFSALAGHSLLDSGQFGSSGGKGRGRFPAVPTDRCNQHATKLVDMYCGNHDNVGCSVCFSTRHREEERKKREAKEKKQQEDLNKQKEKERQGQAERQAIIEQEHRDREIALRLAAEDQNQVEDVTLPPLVRSEAVLAKRAEMAGQKHDLSKWKYAELRDAINTSCDMDLLDACRLEFHRRLKVYHAWKSKNKKQGGKSDDTQRAPTQVVQEAEVALPKSASKAKLSEENGIQRFFKIPFARPADEYREGSHHQGMWYAHFDGNFIARQMEIYPDRPAIMMLAGIDDLNMCELSLEETGLTKKKGAEILGKEFEQEWNKSGGSDYLRKNANKISSKFLQKRLGIAK